MVGVSKRTGKVWHNGRTKYSDLIRGAGNGSAIGTLVERAIKFAILPYLSDGHDAVRVRDAIIRKMAGLPGIPGMAHVGPTRTPTGRRAGTSPRAPIRTSSPRATSTRSPRSSTTGPAKCLDTVSRTRR